MRADRIAFQCERDVTAVQALCFQPHFEGIKCPTRRSPALVPTATGLWAQASWGSFYEATTKWTKSFGSMRRWGIPCSNKVPWGICASSTPCWTSSSVLTMCSRRSPDTSLFVAENERFSYSSSLHLVFMQREPALHGLSIVCVASGRISNWFL